MNKHILSTFIFFFLSYIGFAQTSAEAVQANLEKTGFENIRVKTDGNNYTVSFENNIYRWNVRALSTAIDTITKYTPKNANLNIIQLRFDIPQIITRVKASDWYNFRNDTTMNFLIDTALIVSYKTGNDWKQVKSLKPLNRNTIKFDFVFYPQFHLANLTFNSVYEIQFNIAPALEVSFWKGMLFTAQVILPIYSDSRVYGEEGKLIRPGFIVLSQDFRLPGPVFGNISLGNFNNHRYGIDVNLAYPFRNPRWDIGFNGGFTGSSVYRADGWEVGDIDMFTFSFSAGYFLPRFNLRFKASAGRFLHGDYGGRFDLTRMFGETAIGFYAAYSMEEIGGDGHPNAGFHVAIPFPPGKRLKHRRLRANVPRYFDWEYNGATELIFNRYYERRPNENRSEHYFNPMYIKNELLKNRH